MWPNELGPIVSAVCTNFRGVRPTAEPEGATNGSGAVSGLQCVTDVLSLCDSWVYCHANSARCYGERGWAQTPLGLLRFVVSDRRVTTLFVLITNPTICQDVVDLLYILLYNKSTTNRSNGVCALCRTISEIRRLIGWKLRIFLPPSYSAPRLPMFLLEFCGEV